MNVSVSRHLVGVALYAPAIVRRHLFCIGASFLAIPWGFSRPWLGECYTLKPNTIEGLMIVVYICLDLRKEAP
jgi:hypothetical protein